VFAILIYELLIQGALFVS